MSDVPEGYRMSDVGVIPEEWEVKKLEEYVTIASGESPSKFKFKNNGTPYYKVDQLNYGNKYQKDTPYFIECNNPIPKGSIIFPKRGASIWLNKVRILTEDAFMDTNLMTLTTIEGLDNEYLYYMLIYIGLWHVADTTSIPQINNKHIKPLKIPIPPLPEQQAIASALSDVDALITALEQLITKKRNIKQGAMQQLLTGEKRLPGFGGAWEAKRLGGIAEVRGRVGWKGYTKADLKPSGPLAIGAKHIDNSNRLDLSAPTHLSNDKYLESPEIMVTFNDILIVQRGTIGKLVLIDKRIGEATINPSMVILRVKKDNSSYVYYQLISKTGQAQILSDTSSTGVPMITQKQIEEFIVPLPLLPEQQAIAQILSDMDTEIEALEQKQAKYKAIKQGMMQELLTGKTRLV